MKVKLYQIAIILITGAIFLACKKSSSRSTDCDDYWIDKMNVKWGTKPDCEDKDLYAILLKGKYNGEAVYFEGVDGPGLAYVSMAPLEYVVNCGGDSIKISKSIEMQNVTTLAKSCK